MLVLSRKKDESIIIEVAGHKIVVTVVEIRVNAGLKTRLGVQADADVIIHREEVYEAIQRIHNSEPNHADANPPAEPG